MSSSCIIFCLKINSGIFSGFSIEGKCTITLELHSNNSYGSPAMSKTKGSGTCAFKEKVLEWLKFWCWKYYILPFQLSNEALYLQCVLNSPHVSLTEFTIGRIMSHFLMPLLYFLLICMNLACLIILLINLPWHTIGNVIWHLTSSYAI